VRARFSKQPTASSALEEFRKESEEVKLQEINEELRSTLTQLQEEVAGHRERESLVAETLLAAQKAAKELREHAEADASSLRVTTQADADALRQNAESEAEEILNHAREEAGQLLRSAERERVALTGDVERLRGIRNDVEEAVRALLHKALEALDGTTADGQDLDRLLAQALRSPTNEVHAESLLEGPPE
jgi:cell division septum initiation protein DivIVA